MATRVKKCQAVFLTIGGRNRHRDPRRESIPNGPADPGQWLAPFLHVSRAHVAVCGSVRILSTDNLEGEAARRAVEGEQGPVYVEDRVVPRQVRKKHGLPSFTIGSLRQWCDRPEGRAPSWRIRASVGGIPADWVGRRAVIDKWGTWALAITVRKKSRPMRPTSRAVLQRSNLCAM